MNAAPPRTYLETFAAIIRDRLVSHGAFRLWHALRDYTNAQSKCFPGQRRLAGDLGCDPHSLKPWTQELIVAHWLKVEGGHGRRFNYTVMDGNGQPLRKPATPTAAETRNGGVVENRNTTVVENHNEPLRKPATKVSSPSKSVHLSQGESPRIKILGAPERITHEKELDAIKEKRKQIKDRASGDAFGLIYNEQEKTELRQLKERETELKALLGRKF
jgi:hypothetical protein